MPKPLKPSSPSSPLRGFHLLLLFVLALMPKDSSAAQDPGTGELRVLKLQLRRDLVAVILPEKRLQRDELLALEKKLATAQDFAGAIKARDQRLSLDKEIASLEKELPALQAQTQSMLAQALPERVDLKLPGATILGLQSDPKDGSLSGWSNPSASVTWTLPNLPPGGYEVVVKCAADEVRVRLKEAFYTLDATCKSPPRKPAEQTLGTLRISNGQGTLTLTADPSEKSASLRVYSVALVPVNR